MCFRDDFVGGIEDRRRRRDVRLICECREVRGSRDRDNHRRCGCGCGGRDRDRNRDVVLDCRCRVVGD